MTGLDTVAAPASGRYADPAAIFQSAADFYVRYRPKRWGLGVAPVTNMVHLLEAHGVRVFSLAPEHASVDAYSFWRGDVPYVLLNTMKSGERGRFDAAHELGHLVLHGHTRTHLGPQAEAEANDFASALLMPASSVLARVPAGANVTQILQAKRVWKVAAMALTYRLHDLGMLRSWQYRETCIELSQRGYRKGEPNGISRESSQVLRKVLTTLRHKGITIRHIADDLRLTTDELNGYLFGLVVTAVAGNGTSQQTQPPRLTVVRNS